jgi:hypothetical protein
MDKWKEKRRQIRFVEDLRFKMGNIITQSNVGGLDVPEARPAIRGWYLYFATILAN